MGSQCSSNIIYCCHILSDMGDYCLFLKIVRKSEDLMTKLTDNIDTIIVK